MKLTKKDNFNLDHYEKALKKFAIRGFLPPFRDSGFYVDDRRGDTVIECGNPETAKALAELLNSLPDPELLKKQTPIPESIKVEVQAKSIEKPVLPVIAEESTESKIKKLL